MLTSAFDEAVRHAHDLHRQQRRKGDKVPYVAHLFGVASLALETGATEDEVIAALLHDAVEDQGGSDAAAEIRVRFGDRVAEIVLECSEWSGDGVEPGWRRRKETFIAKIPEISRSALLVASADKLHNARSLLADFRSQGETLWHRFNGGRDGTLWYYRTITDALRAAEAPNRLVNELERVVQEIERMAESA